MNSSSPTISLRNRFTEVLQNIRKRHSSVVETLAQVCEEIAEMTHEWGGLFRVIWNFLILVK